MTSSPQHVLKQEDGEASTCQGQDTSKTSEGWRKMSAMLEVPDPPDVERHGAAGSAATAASAPAVCCDLWT